MKYTRTVAMFTLKEYLDVTFSPSDGGIQTKNNDQKDRRNNTVQKSPIEWAKSPGNSLVLLSGLTPPNVSEKAEKRDKRKKTKAWKIHEELSFPQSKKGDSRYTSPPKIPICCAESHVNTHTRLPFKNSTIFTHPNAAYFLQLSLFHAVD